VASAALHLSPELAKLQARLRTRLELVVKLGRELGVPLLDETLTPIFFVRCGSTRETYAMVDALRAENVCVCAAMYPVVPRQDVGIRFNVSLHNTLEDVARLMEVLAVQSARRGLSSLSR
jgi:7-keto-8-aminopelargonate synthetase-like enzyme